MGRGELTDEVKKVSVDQLGYVVDMAELRLMPYLQYCIMNSEAMSLHKLSDEDHEVLHKWDKKGFIDSVSIRPRLTKMFYVAITEILCVAYCQDSIIN
ncbi:hypothetical protein LCGC14_1000190 [marine sediment metagenome]|uniref:Uncharacterized protein n=1 Tax=marine sediment metagenome TaxID=412755 RepID=A0A0F9R9C0_9ZZZZ